MLASYSAESRNQLCSWAGLTKEWTQSIKVFGHRGHCPSAVDTTEGPLVQPLSLQVDLDTIQNVTWSLDTTYPVQYLRFSYRWRSWGKTLSPLSSVVNTGEANWLLRCPSIRNRCRLHRSNSDVLGRQSGNYRLFNDVSTKIHFFCGLQQIG